MANDVALAKTITGHHTVWIGHDRKRSVPIRYANTDDDIICFGDGQLAEIPGGAMVTCTVYEIACGPPLMTFQANVREVPGDELSLSTIASVHGNAPDPSSDRNPYRALQTDRRFLALRPLD